MTYHFKQYLKLHQIAHSIFYETVKTVLLLHLSCFLIVFHADSVCMCGLINEHMSMSC